MKTIRSRVLGACSKWLLAVGSCWLWMPAGFAVNFPLTWRWSNPLPHGNNIIDMALTNGSWLQVTERGQIYTAGDIKSFVPRESHSRNSLRAVTFFNGQIVITGENGTIVYGESPADLRMIDLGTSDWLEGVAASPNLLVAVGDNAAIYTSSTGTNWLRQTAPFTNWLRSVTYATPAGRDLFVTVGEAGLIATSADGVNWQRRAAPTAQDLNRVVWNNGQFWAVGDLAQTLVSNSGIQWQAVHSGATNTLSAAAGTNGLALVAGDSELRLQENGGPWLSQLLATQPSPAPAWTYLSAVWTGNSFLLGGQTGMLVEGVKTNAPGDPTVWHPVFDSLRNWLWDVARLPGQYLAVGDHATVMSSLDGIDWAQEAAPDSTADTVFLGVGGRTNLAVAVGSGGSIIVSTDDLRTVVRTNASGTLTTNQVSALGIVWRAIDPRPTTNDLQGVAFLGSLDVITGAAGTILTSSDGTNWVRRISPTRAFLSSADSFPGGVVAVGDGGAILTSPDAMTWRQRFSGTTNWLYRVRYVGGKLIAVGQNGAVFTSADGADWASQSSGTSQWLTAVEFVGDTYFILGTHGTVLASTNAVDWTSIGAITAKSLFGAASTRGQLTVVGVEGVILRTQVVPIDTPVKFLGYPRTPAQNVFLFSGQPDQRFTLDRSTNLIDWSIGPQLEILDHTGTQFYQDNGTNATSVQFFRTRVTP